MKRLDHIRNLIETDFSSNILIEPEFRCNQLTESINEVIHSYNPEVVLKAGLGSGKLLYDIVKNNDIYMVVVEPSLEVIEKFVAKYENDSIFEKLRFINGDFSCMPVDYYAANLVLCIDYFDFIESGIAVDEFRRILEFECVLFIATDVLNDEDFDGVYDDLIRMVCPVHNDYYLADDIRTYFELNDFKYIKSQIDYYNDDIYKRINYYKSIFNSTDEADKFISENREKFESLYKLNENTVSLPYYTGLFMRKNVD